MTELNYNPKPPSWVKTKKENLKDQKEKFPEREDSANLIRNKKVFPYSGSLFIDSRLKKEIETNILIGFCLDEYSYCRIGAGNYRDIKINANISFNKNSFDIIISDLKSGKVIKEKRNLNLNPNDLYRASDVALQIVYTFYGDDAQVFFIASTNNLFQKIIEKASIPWKK